MNLSALLTSAGINVGICVVLFILYSVLRKQPSNASVYFGRRLASSHIRRSDPFCFERLVPSPSWMMKAWETTEQEILTIGGFDTVVFFRIIVFSMRIFSISAVICTFLVLPVNYHGQEMIHKQIPSESLDVFTIVNVKENSKWLWVHCLALYIISFSACILLYFESKSITKMRLAHIAGCPLNPGLFTVLVRAIPWSAKETYSDLVKQFFTKYHASSYLSHQMVHRSGTVQKLMGSARRASGTMFREIHLVFAKTDAENMYKMVMDSSAGSSCKTSLCGFCGGPTTSFQILSNEAESIKGRLDSANLNLETRKKVASWWLNRFDLTTDITNFLECAAAFVFFKTRYAAIIASNVLQSSNPMSWVTDLAPEPHDVYWSSLCVPYRQLWIRKIGILLASIAFMIVFVIPVTFVQSLTQLDQLQQALPFLREILKKKFMNQIVTGYLPSVILILFLYLVPPMMMLFSAVEGSISRSERKKSACYKVLYFTIWNVFFMNIFTGSIIRQLSVFSSVKDIPAQLAKAVPTQASFFMTYVLSSGWASIACEIMQLFPLLCNFMKKWIFRMKDDSCSGTLSFPYHTEVPRLLLFGFLGFTCSILAPLILPLLLLYFCLAYLVYRNQILNVYVPKYDSGGQFWPIAHNTYIFSLVLTQIIALGVFGIKQSPVASGFTIPLVIGTLLFHEYCRQRFLPIFKNISAEVLIEMDRKDKQSGKMEDIYQQLKSAYCQFTITPHLCRSGCLTPTEDGSNNLDPENLNTESECSQVRRVSWNASLEREDKAECQK